MLVLKRDCQLFVCSTASGRKKKPKENKHLVKTDHAKVVCFLSLSLFVEAKLSFKQQKKKLKEYKTHTQEETNNWLEKLEANQNVRECVFYQTSLFGSSGVDNLLFWLNTRWLCLLTSVAMARLSSLLQTA